MFLEILDKYIISWIEIEKIKYLFSKRNRPDVIIKNDKDHIIALSICLKINTTHKTNL